MKLESISRMKNIDTGTRKKSIAASKRIAKSRRPRLSFEPLEDRSLLSAPGDIEWLHQFGGGSLGGGVGRAVDADGNVYIAGRPSAILPGQSGPGHAFVRKYDADGIELWTRQFGSPGTDNLFFESATAVAVHGSSLYVVGQTGGALPGQMNAGVTDAFVRKYDVDGNEIWTRQFGSMQGDAALCVAADDTGVYLGGRTLGALPGQTSAGFADAFVRKYDPAGTELWTHQFGAASNFGEHEQASSIAMDSSGVYVAGRIGLPNASGGIADAFLRKYDAGGNAIWFRQFGTARSDQANGVSVDASGVYVAGFVGLITPATGGDAFVSKYDADGTEVWTRQFGTTGVDRATGIAVDATGVYVAGATEGALPGQTSAGGLDAFVRKYDSAGTEVWTRQFGTVNALNLDRTDEATGVAVDATGVYVVGNAIAPLPGQPGSGQPVSGGAFLRKYNGSGGEIWTRQLLSITSRDDVARAVDADGNLYVAGEIAGSIALGQTIVGDIDAFVRKYDAAGNELWTRQFGTLLRDAVNGIAVDASGVYVAGLTGFGNALPGQNTAGNTDAFVRKYDAAGNVVWTSQFGSTVADTATGVAVDSSGVYVVGTVGSNGALPGQTSSGDTDAFVRKYDLAGTALWTRQFGGNIRTGPVVPSPSDSATGIAVDATGAYVSGLTLGTFAGQTSPGGQDAFVRSYDSAGNLNWTRQFGTASTDLATGIAAGSSGIYVSGATAGTFAGQTSTGGQDAFLRRFNAAGTDLWTRQFGTTGLDQANGVSAGPTGIYVAGFVGGALAGETSAGGQDAFVRKYDTGGDTIWTGQFGTAGTDSAAGVTTRASGLFVAGSTTGVFPGQISSGGDLNVFVAKIEDSVASNTPPSNVSLNLNGSVNENGAATLSGSFIDPDTADTHTVVVDWGDGATTTVNLAAGVTTFTASHTYLDDNPPGTASDDYTVSATVTEPVGGSASGSAIITVNNVAPTAGDDSAVTNEDQVATIDVLANDSDIAGALDSLEILSVTNGLKGTASIDTKGTPATTDDEIVYTPNNGATGSDSFTYTITDGDGATVTATVSVQIRNLVDLSGRVFDDKDNDGAYEPADGDVGIGGVSVQLFDETSGALVATLTTAADGTYNFDVNLSAGAYKVFAAQPSGFLDGRETAGNLGGTADSSQDSNQITDISVGQPGATLDAIDYLFAEILPSQALGLVWIDADNEGDVDFGEEAIANVIIELTGVDDRGNAVSRSATTDASGVYTFQDLRPTGAAGYTIREIQPAGYVDGLDALGTVNGVAVGVNSANDTFSGVVLPRPNSLAENYNFGERRLADGGVQHGQTATIGYWQNKNGQNLIKSLNGGATSTQLGNWLAATFPNMYGALAGDNGLAGKTNAEVAAFYKTLFARTAGTAAGGGPSKMDAQVMATALAVYVTNQLLAGTTAASYGFLVTTTGVGTRTFNIGSSGTAFGVGNNANVTVLDLLSAVNSRSRNGLLYDLDGDGDADDSPETSYRTMANDVFSDINETGDI